MKTPFKYILGIFLIVLAGIGIIFSISGIILVQSVKTPLIKKVSNSIDEVISILDTTAEGLDLASESLKTAEASSATLKDSITVIGDTIEHSTHWLDTAATLSRETFPNTVYAVQESLRSAETSAKLVDDTLRLLSAIPFFPAERYNPEVPLSTAIRDINADLNDLPGIFQGITDDLEDASTNSDLIQAQIASATAQMDSIQTSLASTQQVITKYQGLVSKLQPRMQTIKERLPGLIRLAATGLSIFFVWMGLAQIGLIVQGTSLMER